MIDAHNTIIVATLDNRKVKTPAFVDGLKAICPRWILDVRIAPTFTMNNPPFGRHKALALFTEMFIAYVDIGTGNVPIAQRVVDRLQVPYMRGPVLVITPSYDNIASLLTRDLQKLLPRVRISAGAPWEQFPPLHLV